MIKRIQKKKKNINNIFVDEEGNDSLDLLNSASPLKRKHKLSSFASPDLSSTAKYLMDSSDYLMFEKEYCYYGREPS